MKTKLIKTKYSDQRFEFKGKYIEGCLYKDGSGDLFTLPPKKFLPNADYGCESGTHKMRASDIHRLAKFYTSASKELKKLEEKIKFK